MPVTFDLDERQKLTAGTDSSEMNYGSNGNNASGDGNNNRNGDGDGDDRAQDDEGSYQSSVSTFTGGEASFRDAKSLPDVIATLNNDNVWLSTRGAAGTMPWKERSPSGTYDIMEDGTRYGTIPTLAEERFALVCDANLTQRDHGGLYYDETAFYNDRAVPYFVVTVNPYIYRGIASEVWRSTTVPCGMYFCCQGGDGAHTGEAHEDFVSIRLAHAAVAVVFSVMFVVALLPGDEEWNN